MQRVLIADDEPAIVMPVRDELQFEGFDVQAAGTGRNIAENRDGLKRKMLLAFLQEKCRNFLHILPKLCKLIQISLRYRSTR